MNMPSSTSEDAIDRFTRTYVNNALASGNTGAIEQAAQLLGVQPSIMYAAYEKCYKPFPVDALPRLLRDYVLEASGAINCDPSFVVLSLLPMLASCIGTTRAVLLKRSWREYCILWTVIVASSGTRKTPALKAVLGALRRVEARAMTDHKAALDLHQYEYAEYERKLTAWKRSKSGGEPPVKPEPPAAMRYIINDVTVEAIAPILLTNPRGVLLARDELAGWVGDMDRYSQSRGGDVARWLSAWSAEPITVDRRTSGTIHVPMAAVSVTGTIQPEVLGRVLGRDLRENGLAARLLLAMPPRRPGKWTDADISPETEGRLAHIVERLLTLEHLYDGDGNPHPVDVPLTGEALAAFITWHDEHETSLANEVGDLAAALAKMRGYCARLALIFQLVRWASGETDSNAIDVQSISSAITLVGWFGSEARRIYGAMDDDESAAEQRRLIDWIAQRGGSVSVRDLTHGLRRYRGDNKLAERDLDALVKAGRGIWEYPCGPGRPTARFQLLDGVAVTETPSREYVSGGNGDGDSGREVNAPPVMTAMPCRSPSFIASTRRMAVTTPPSPSSGMVKGVAPSKVIRPEQGT